MNQRQQIITAWLLVVCSLCFIDGIQSTQDTINGKYTALAKGTEVSQEDLAKIRVFKRRVTVAKSDIGIKSRLFKRLVDPNAYGLDSQTTLDIYRYIYPPSIGARIGDVVFSCRQDDGILVVSPDGTVTPQLVNGLFEWHPVPGIWWFIQCVPTISRAGGFGLDMTSAQKPGGDSGINPSALKSLVG